MKNFVDERLSWHAEFELGWQPDPNFISRFSQETISHILLIYKHRRHLPNWRLTRDAEKMAEYMLWKNHEV